MKSMFKSAVFGLALSIMFGTVAAIAMPSAVSAASSSVIPIPGTCPFSGDSDVAVPGDILLVTFGDRLLSTDPSDSPKSVTLPAGDYKVSLAAHDEYLDREDAPTSDQSHEQWKVVFQDALGTDIAESGATPDLQDGVATASAELINDLVTLPSDVTDVLAMHAFDAELKPNSVEAVCATFELVSLAATNTPPVIELLGNATVDLTVGDTFNDPMASSTDAEDGDLTGSIVISGDTVATSTVGTYTVVYTVTDTGGLSASVSRTVNVNPAGGSGGPGGPSGPGSIMVCKMILNEDGTVATSSAGLPSGSFSVEVGHKADNVSATTTLATVTFSASGFAPNTMILSATENDAECVTPTALTNLATTTPGSDASYVYDLEQVTGSDWSTPLYNDEDSSPASATTTFYAYGANSDSDGFIELGDVRDDRRLVILNTATATGSTPTTTPPSNNGGGGGGGGGGGRSSNLRITDEEVEMVVPGIAFVTWETNRNATSQVVYGKESIDDDDIDEDDEDDNFGYESVTVEIDDLIDEHGMAVGGLENGVRYYFRPVSRRGSQIAIGDEVSIVPGGEANSCIYLRDYLKRGWDNDPTEVMKLQIFLREVEGHSSLEITGVFDDATFRAVSAFQEKYKPDILTPWGHDSATGFVYILTKKKVNEIYCQQIFPLTPAQQQEIVEFRAFLESLESRGISIPTDGGPSESEPSDENDGVIPGETEIGLGGEEEETGTSTGDVLDRGIVGNLTAAIFSLPENGTEATRCIFNLIIILAIIYIITSILVSNDETAEMTRKKIRTRKLAFFLAGVIIAAAFALFFDMFCLILPLFIALLVVIALLIANRTKGADSGPTSGPAGTPPTSPLIVETPKKAEPVKKEPAPVEPMPAPTPTPTPTPPPSPSPTPAPAPTPSA